MFHRPSSSDTRGSIHLNIELNGAWNILYIGELQSCRIVVQAHTDLAVTRDTHQGDHWHGMISLLRGMLLVPSVNNCDKKGLRHSTRNQWERVYGMI